MTPEKELQIIEAAMRERGYRWTHQRRLIVEAALATHEHFSADELHDMCRAQDDNVSRATVYRTLGVLEEAGFVGSLDMGEGGKRYEHVIGHEHHDHMICTECGRVAEFRNQDLEKLKVKIAKAETFKIQSHSLRIFGLCGNCQ